ncbi:Exoglucanase [Drechslerella dactyloides]|uniref:Beta-xylanase n=1 Tax=Drechslerella dactyloides TaxID=74499 RepID=A0AAD6IT06_DREDA|nr:Exoglucanase [Drechslerella dactyloides]
MKAYVALALAAPMLVTAQQSMWGQCGGIGWTGPTACNPPAGCSTLNPYYAQCLSTTGGATTTRTTTTTSRTMTTTTRTTTPATTTTTSRTTTTTSRTTTGNPPTGTGLDALIKGKGKKYVGFCADSGLLSNAQNAAILQAESGQLTPENSMKWQSIEPSQNSFSYGGADTLVNWAVSNNKIIRGHTFVWHSQLPSWVSNINNKATLTTVIQNHINAVAGRYKGKIYAWDVANEVFNDDGTRRSSVFSNVFGDWTFLDVAFRAARAADPAAKLCLNDYNLDYSGAKLTNFVQLVKDLIARGVPIDCVGTQSHLVVGNGAIPSFKTTLDSLASTGLEVQITELDIRTNSSPSSAQISQQVRDYTSVVSACMKTAACSGITVWGVSDKDSWVPQTFSGQGYALLWDNNYQKKQAYNGFVTGINS